MSISDVFMEPKLAEPKVKIDKNVLLGKAKKLGIFKNLLSLIYRPQIRENLGRWAIVFSTLRL